MVIILSVVGTKEPRQFSVVVLPEPVPPETMIFAGFTSYPSTASHRKAATSGPRVPKLIISKIVKGSALNFLMVREGPPKDIGGTVAFTRDPSLNLASNKGEEASTRLPTDLAILAIIFIASSSVSKTIFVLHMPCFL